MTTAAAMYAAVAYWLFWRAIQYDPRVPGETPALVVARAALYLMLGPALLAGAWAIAELATIGYRHAEIHEG